MPTFLNNVCVSNYFRKPLLDLIAYEFEYHDYDCDCTYDNPCYRHEYYPAPDPLYFLDHLGVQV